MMPPKNCFFYRIRHQIIGLLYFQKGILVLYFVENYILGLVIHIQINFQRNLVGIWAYLVQLLRGLGQ